MAINSTVNIEDEFHNRNQKKHNMESATVCKVVLSIPDLPLKQQRCTLGRIQICSLICGTLGIYGEETSHLPREVGRGSCQVPRRMILK